jgi:hypothetical protein
MNKFVYLPKGNEIALISIKTVTNTLIIPIAVGLFSIFPIMRKMRKWDPVAVIERRE